MSKDIFEYINTDPISFIHVRDLLDKNYSIIYESNKGFIIKDNVINYIYISFNDKDVMKEELSKHRYEHYIAYNQEIVDFYEDNNKVIMLEQYVYPNDKLFDIEDKDIRVLDVTYSSYIDSFYKAINPSESSINALIKKDILGIFENNELAGIIGVHPEGCIGMLHILEAYRGKGYGEVLEKAMINKLIKENRKIFCEVVLGNTISEHLQSKLGLVRGDKIIYWLV